MLSFLLVFGTLEYEDDLLQKSDSPIANCQ